MLDVDVIPCFRPFEAIDVAAGFRELLYRECQKRLQHSRLAFTDPEDLA